MGGGQWAQPLLAAGLVDEIGLNIHPILLGTGIPTFRDPGHRVRLTLTECRELEGGCILAIYKVLDDSVNAGPVKPSKNVTLALPVEPFDM
jgi:riboflavin biosynthesis pyrimidine reductase